MSKNFELLRRAGWAEECLEGIPDPGDSTRERFQPGTVSLPHDSDQISILVQKIFGASGNPSIRAVLFTAVTGSASSVCVRAAQKLAGQARNRVCLVDANVHSPSVHRYFGQQNVVGLTDAIADPKRTGHFVAPTPGKNLWFLPAGSPNANRRSILASPGFSSCLKDLKRYFEYLLIDGACTSTHKISALGDVVDGAVLVMSSSGVAPDIAVKARERLHAAKVKLLGIVLDDPKTSLLDQLRN
jgi:Mrp family chromosome partitioning ATPase